MQTPIPWKVQPGFRNIILILIEQCTKIYEQLQQIREPRITPASMLAYCLSLIYGYGYFVKINQKQCKIRRSRTITFKFISKDIKKQIFFC